MTQLSVPAEREHYSRPQCLRAAEAQAAGAPQAAPQEKIWGFFNR
jgi:hypothetical protein